MMPNKLNSGLYVHSASTADLTNMFVSPVETHPSLSATWTLFKSDILGSREETLSIASVEINPLGSIQIKSKLRSALVCRINGKNEFSKINPFGRLMEKMLKAVNSLSTPSITISPIS